MKELGILNRYEALKGKEHIKQLTKKGHLAFILKKARNDAGYTQSELAKEMNIPVEKIKTMENNFENNDIEVILAVAKKIKIEVSKNEDGSFNFSYGKNSVEEIKLM